MALLSIHLRNGDTLHFGKDPEQTRAAYDALLAQSTEFVELQGYFNHIPRFAIRCSEVIVLMYDPNDNSTSFASTALARTAQYYSFTQQSANADGEATGKTDDVKV
jgi:hypothetical protein